MPTEWDLKDLVIQEEVNPERTAKYNRKVSEVHLSLETIISILEWEEEASHHKDLSVVKIHNNLIQCSDLWAWVWEQVLELQVA